MNLEEKSIVLDAIINDGFDYAIQHKSSWKEITDERFHKLRDAYLAARKELAEYVGSNN